MIVRWHPAARAEADAAAAFYGDKRRGLAGRFLNNLEDAVQRAMARPGIYPQLEPGIRSCRLKSFPHALVFRGGRDIEIIAVMHLRRRPGYWRDRT